MNALVDAWMADVPGEFVRNIEPVEPAIAEMFVDDDGILWVQNSRSGRNQPDGVLMTYDTFNAEGEYLQQVSVACEGDPAYDGLRFLGDGNVLLIKGYVLARWTSMGARGVDFGEEANSGPMEIIHCAVR